MLELIYIAKFDFLASPNTALAKRLPDYDDETETTDADRAGPRETAAEQRDGKTARMRWRDRA